jgi:poly-beta-1,6-N-acetyl-D-glucosamine synthase
MGRFRRAIGVVVFGGAVLGAVLLAAAIALTSHGARSHPDHGLLFGAWKVVYDTQAPSPRVMTAAFGIALLAASGVAFLEWRISTRDRRSDRPHDLPLAPKIVMRETRGVYAGPITVTVLIPAHNEEACIGNTIASLVAQSATPERIVVVADNCTDRTAEIALAAGVEVFSTVGNTQKKAGALNQALTQVLDDQGDNDLVMVMDADTTLDDGFLAGARRRMEEDRALTAVGGLFYGEDGQGVLGQFQRNEYTRYAREMSRRRGRVFVLTGTASLFRPRALHMVAAHRGGLLPGVRGDVYDTLALTEDNELTLALKCLGGLMISPSECTVVTEVMPTWRALWAQRLRWQRGALENLGEYGVLPQTFRYWAQQLGIGYGVLALSSYLVLITLMAVSLDSWVWFPFWVGLGVVFSVERMVTVWKGGWRARILSALLLPELCYAMFLNTVYVKGVLDITLGRQARWKHVVQSEGRTVRVSE